jgi:hypothetical protein
MASPRFSCQMPCLLDSPPVLTFLLWPWPKPGLMRSQTGCPRRRSPICVSMSSEPALIGTPVSSTRSMVSSVRMSAV